MGYWVASELSARLPQAVQGQPIITGSSTPIDLAELQDLIAGFSSEFDSAAAHAGYETPIPTTATQGYAIARLVTYNGARAHVMQTISVGRDASLAGEYRSAYLRAIDEIQRGLRPLPNAPGDTGESGRVLPRSGGNASPTITMDREF